MLLHQIPEAAGMVHLAEMRQLVNYDIVDDRLRSHDELPVEVEIALLRATAPARFGRPYPELPASDAQQRTENVHSGPNVFFRLQPIPPLQNHAPVTPLP